MKIFGQREPPVLPYIEKDLGALALELIQSQTAVTGVQPKLSLNISHDKGSTIKRFTIVGMWGGYILKTPTPHYRQLPEVEDLTMHMAAASGIKTAPHSLIRMDSGSLAYITKRIDRTKTGKLAMEDMCQLTERMTEAKYRGSYEQIAKAIQRYSAAPGLDIVNFAELVLFSFLTGNADMHLKNFSLIEQPGLGMTLSPAYDLVATALVNPADKEELALTLNGKKKKIRLSDFEAAFRSFGIDASQQKNIFKKMHKAKSKWFEYISTSFLDDGLKEAYEQLLAVQFERLVGANDQ